MSSVASHHSEWLSLIEIGGPFLTLPVLLRAFPQGLPKPDQGKVRRLRVAYEEWADAQEGSPNDAAEIHAAWIQLVLNELLELDDTVLCIGNRLPIALQVTLSERHETLRPDMAIVEPHGRVKAGTPRLLVSTWPLSQDLESPTPDARWAAGPLERMTQLCRSTGVRLGLVTNGERWTLIDAPVGQAAGHASWYAGLWLQEPLSLAAFITLLDVRRLFGVEERDTLEAMLDESVAYQQEVTDQLGYQVRRAVEVLVQALDRADFDRQRELLRDVTPDRLYEASLTMMMRLVVLFCAEERGLLLLGDETYDANYAVSTLRAQLREEANVVGLEVLERRQDAWARLLATVRAVHGGIEHEALRLPALGGSLFNPDRFPFLEGRAAGTAWVDTPASPLPIDNRTVLYLLEALQLLRMRPEGGKSEVRKLSYRALDIEQIGHVYEGLLDHAAVRVDADTVGLIGTKAKEPELTIDTMERERLRGKEVLVAFLKEETGRSPSALRNALDSEVDEEVEQQLLVACDNDKTLLRRLLPYHALIRRDAWGYPQIYRAGSFIVTGGMERRQSGTHYTPKPLTEKIVVETLEPLVYKGAADGKPRADWKLKSPGELLELKICDIAVGSAAFLVQVCRWLGERVVEAWGEAERKGKFITVSGEVLDKANGLDLLPDNREERLSLARRLIAERCIYGVDLNPMAVELAKLSLWIVTLAKGRPFGFLDHNLRCGDSLLGVSSLEQVKNFHFDPEKGRALHGTLFDPRHDIQTAVDRALDLREKLTSVPILDIEDVKAMERIDNEARRVLERPGLVADLLTGVTIAFAGQHGDTLDEQIVEIADRVARWLREGGEIPIQLKRRAEQLLDTGRPDALRSRRAFHWAIEFPEVFARDRPGFDAIVGNPPFLFGKRISGVLGDAYATYLRQVVAATKGSADLVVYFLRRGFSLLREEGSLGLIATNTVSQADSREVGLAEILDAGAIIYSAISSTAWSGTANVHVSLVTLRKGTWAGSVTLDGQHVTRINSFLRAEGEESAPADLICNAGLAHIGSYPLGTGFYLSQDRAGLLLESNLRNKDVIRPFVGGSELYKSPDFVIRRWIIDFRDMPLTEAQRYKEPLDIVRREVKPQRDALKRASYRERWWQFAERQTGLYQALAGLEKCIVKTRTSSTFAFLLLPTEVVFDTSVVVMACSRLDVFAVLQSSLHEMWARYFSPTLKADLIYSPTDCVRNFPFPFEIRNRRAETNVQLAELARLHLEVRQECMTNRNIGLTKLSKLVNSEACTDTDVCRLRRSQVKLDGAVAFAYGWKDVELQHAFSTEGVSDEQIARYGISAEAKSELLRRLIELNRKYARHVDVPSSKNKLRPVNG